MLAVDELLSYVAIAISLSGIVTSALGELFIYVVIAISLSSVG